MFASQVQQVIYVQDRRETEWFVPIPMKPRERYDLGEDGEDENVFFMDTEPHIIEIEGASEVEIDATSLVEGIYIQDDHMEDIDEEDELDS